MKIIIKGKRGFKVDPNLRSYAIEKIRKYEEFVREPAVCEVVFSDAGGPKGGQDKVVTITMTLPGEKNPIHVKQGTEDFIGSIDLVQERLEKILMKYKDHRLGSRFPKKYWVSKEANIEESQKE